QELRGEQPLQAGHHVAESEALRAAAHDQPEAAVGSLGCLGPARRRERRRGAWTVQLDAPSKTTNNFGTKLYHMDGISQPDASARELGLCRDVL
ncbi:unnamed protein product, partial [Prorocentrum cordatum]